MPPTVRSSPRRTEPMAKVTRASPLAMATSAEAVVPVRSTGPPPLPSPRRSMVRLPSTDRSMWTPGAAAASVAAAPMIARGIGQLGLGRGGAAAGDEGEGGGGQQGRCGAGVGSWVQRRRHGLTCQTCLGVARRGPARPPQRRRRIGRGPAAAIGALPLTPLRSCTGCTIAMTVAPRARSVRRGRPVEGAPLVASRRAALGCGHAEGRLDRHPRRRRGPRASVLDGRPGLRGPRQRRR